MGIYDRDYIRQSPPAPGRYGRGGLSAIRMWSVNTWIIVACIAVYVIDGFLPMRLVEMSGPYLFDGVPGVPATAVVAEHAPRRVVVREVDVHGNTREKEIFGRAFLERPGGGQIGWVEVAPMHTLESFLHFSTKRGFMKVEFWRLIGFQFLHTHATLAHILFNMLGLYFFGPIAERYLGPKRYLAFYLLCGIFGALLYVMLNLGGLLAAMFAGIDVKIPGLLFNDLATPLIGASAGVFGVLMAGAFLAPRATVLLFFILPMQLRTLAYALVGLAFFSVLFGGRNAGGEAGHLGGAFAGFYFIRHPQHLHGFFDILGRIDPTSHHYRGRRGLRRPAVDRGQVDRILEKINASGLQSLTDKEKRMLREASERK
ncbi:MAG: rhomboid family intramembrane serine protease [Planctomycetota bacterium]|jgi:membrane associated rhomboid family serine protease